ncbi:D-3-phosphoglycerate dehydrogenase [Pseudomonas flavescens]|uniref:D-3-phosphoglycerate dehydrogenase n=1 Tax=Phytopseudomonas flavescens TaxID=29435 RepID=A0A1G8M089_9GAMM|nr:phosphoglycerate dehydrogenase [Pseudomonas flavescens]SDI61305.1 D-3-phosphoglycerate dehydrogenase [Pseudomonas flavescens]
MRVVSTSPSFAQYSQEPLALLAEHGIDHVRLPADLDEDAFIEQARDAQAAIVAFTPITARVLDALPQLRLVCKHGVGVDNIDVAAARARGVKVCNVPGANRHAVADFTFALLLALARQIPQADRLTRAGQWPRLFGAGVHGKTLGIVGLGNIGREVARRARGFDMPVLAYDPYPAPELAQQLGVEFCTLEALCRRSDFISLHVGLDAGTHHLIDAQALARMKPTAMLINAARGGIVDEQALLATLRAGGLAGAALDAFEQEPPYGSELLGLDNVIATSHIAGYTEQALTTLSLACVENVIRSARGTPLMHVVSD